MNKLVIMRGVSGSGKSTLATQIADAEYVSVIYSTDDFFTVDGEYKFDPKKLGEFHAANVERTKSAMVDNCPCIIIDNTNTKYWEMKPYVELAVVYGYTVVIKEPEPVGFDELMKRQALRADQNKALPAAILRRMISRYEHDATVEKILASKRPHKCR